MVMIPGQTGGFGLGNFMRMMMMLQNPQFMRMMQQRGTQQPQTTSGSSGVVADAPPLIPMPVGPDLQPIEPPSTVPANPNDPGAGAVEEGVFFTPSQGSLGSPTLRGRRGPQQGRIPEEMLFPVGLGRFSELLRRFPAFRGSRGRDGRNTASGSGSF